jgi:hypothetical protein
MVFFFINQKIFAVAVLQMMDIVDMAIQMGGAREHTSFVLKM